LSRKGGKYLNSLFLKKEVHQGMKWNENIRLAAIWGSPCKSGNRQSGGVPELLSNLLKFKEKKGGELEGLT
jgi:hypothetical protein